MNDQRKKRRSVDAIAHLFLSCWDENHETTGCNQHTAPPESRRLPSAIRIVPSDPGGHEISSAPSQVQEGVFTSIEPPGLAAGPIGHSAGQSEGLESQTSLQLVIDPCVYPVARLIWAEATSQDGVLEATIPLRGEVWLDVAECCKQRAEQLEISGLYQLANTWNRVVDLVLSEIIAAEKRQRNRDLYGSFADFVATISTRTDMDKVRKAQMIHEKACQLQVD